MSLVPVETLVAGELAVDVLPTRGLDLAGARWRGVRFSWESPLGHIPWQGDFARSFGGGLLVTCGLRNAGAPSEGQPQHGWYSSLPARGVEIGAATATGRVVDAEVPGPALELARSIEVTPGGVCVTDTVTNIGSDEEPAPLLLHVNLLWGAVDIDAAETVPRDDDAAAGDWRSLGPRGPERVYEHRGATRAHVVTAGARVTVTSDLPRLWQWIHPAYGVVAVEPANCSVLGREHDREHGELPVLAPGERRTTTLAIAVEDA
jgi:Domain of unknown function (DUF4432)